MTSGVLPNPWSPVTIVRSDVLLALAVLTSVMSVPVGRMMVGPSVPSSAATPSAARDWKPGSRAAEREAELDAACSVKNESIEDCQTTVLMPTSGTDTIWFAVINGSAGQKSYTISCVKPTGYTCTMSPTFLSIPAGNEASTRMIFTSPGSEGTGTITVNAGSSLSATVTANVASARVTPDNQAITRGPNRTYSQAFTVKNRGTATHTYNLSASCSNAGWSCSAGSSSTSLAAGDSTSVNVSYTTGAVGSFSTVQLKATSTAGAVYYDTGYVNVTVTKFLTASTSFTNQDFQSYALCASACFAATASHTTVPYVSLDAPRSVTVAYNGDRVAVRPFIYADVQVQPGSQLQYYKLSAQVNWGAGWSNVTFLNGETTLRFTGDTTRTVRLGGQFDASGFASKPYPLRITVTAEYPNAYTETVTDSSHLLLVLNERQSPVARGWRIAGVPRLYENAGVGVLIAEGDGSANVYKYLSTDANGKKSYSSPTGDPRVVTYNQGGSGQFLRVSPDSLKEVFNAAGQPLYVLDRLSRRIDFTHDGSGRLTQITDPYRTQPGVSTKTYVTLAYGSYGLTSITEPGSTGTPGAGRATTFTVAADSTLTSATDPDNVTTTFRYDAVRRLQHLINRRGDTTTLAYAADSSWKISSIALPRDTVDSSGVLLLRRPTTTLTPWQTRGVPYGATSVTAATAISADSTYAVVLDPEGHRTTITVDRWGQPTRIVQPTSKVTTITRSGINPTSITSPSGATDEFEYTGHLLTGFKRSGQAIWTNFHYGAFAQLDTVYVDGDVVEKRTLGPGGRTDTLTAGGLKTRFYYDSLQRDTLRTDAGAHKVRSRYHAATGNRDSVITLGATDNRIGLELRRFDRYGRDSVTQVSQLPPGTTLYDVMNRPISIRDGVTDSAVTLTYDALHLLRVKDAKGQVFRREVSPAGFVKKIFDPADTLSRFVLLRYNKDGLVARQVNRRGIPITQRYDSLHRLISRSDTTAPADSFYFSPNGSLVVATNSISTDSIFNSVGANQLTWVDSVVTWLGGKRFRRYYRPNAQYRVDSMNVSMGSTGSIDFAARRYYFDPTSGRLDSLNINSARSRFHYNAEGLRDSTHFAVGGSRIDSISSQHLSYTTRFTATSLDTAFWRSYSRDSLGRVTSEQRKAGTQGVIRRFSYDSLGRLGALETEDIASLTCDPPPSGQKSDMGCDHSSTGTTTDLRGYEYDKAWNLTKETDSLAATTSTLTYSTGNRLIGMSQGPVTDSVDLDGNRIYFSDGTSTFRYYWSADNRLTKVTSGARTIEYAYNAVGQLVRRSVNGSVDRYFLRDQGHLLAELNSTASDRVSEYVYLPGIDQPFAVVTGVTGSAMVRYVHQDEMGNVLGVFSGTGAANRTFRYLPWGDLEASAGTLADSLVRLRWKGMFWEGDSTKLYHARARWYDPKSRRFMSEDPIGLDGGLNQYVFAANDPINGSDPSGALCIWVNEQKTVFQGLSVTVVGFYRPVCANLLLLPVPTSSYASMLGRASTGERGSHRRSKEVQACIDNARDFIMSAALDWVGGKLLKGGAAALNSASDYAAHVMRAQWQGGRAAWETAEGVTSLVITTEEAARAYRGQATAALLLKSAGVGVGAGGMAGNLLLGGSGEGFGSMMSLPSWVRVGLEAGKYVPYAGSVIEFAEAVTICSELL